jgi:glycerophosphoryl diester phosphodiesterase
MFVVDPNGAGAKIILPPVIGHRGAAANAPENTLAGLRQAKALDCRWVEFDVRLTADGQPILLHDDRLQRTTDGRGKVSALSLAALRHHDAGGWFGPSFAGERVPTLQEAVMLLAELGLGANVELKATQRREAETGIVVAELLDRLWPHELPPPLISSFRRGALAAAQARAPRIARGMLFRAVPKNWRTVAESFGCTTIHADHQRLHPALVSEIGAAGYPLLAYTVNDPARAKTLFDWGVTSVFSDAPRRLFDAGVRRAAHPPNAADSSSARIPRQGSFW